MLMPWLISRYWGIVLYFVELDLPLVRHNGGSAPVTGRHSMIERPESVSRVAPPTSASRHQLGDRQQPYSQVRGGRGVAGVATGVAGASGHRLYAV